MQVEVALPNRGVVSGMGVSRGVTLIVGGGFHGKSTLLKAIEAGVYNHIPGVCANRLPMMCAVNNMFS
jgi:predicted ABC-class ATPase